MLTLNFVSKEIEVQGNQMIFRIFDVRFLNIFTFHYTVFFFLALESKIIDNSQGSQLTEPPLFNILDDWRQ